MGFLGKSATFVRIVESGSLSAAGRSLGLSLAAISRQLASLESELGVSLLLRTPHSQQLTDEGRRFHAVAAKLVRDAEAARTIVHPDGRIAGDFVLSASVSLGLLRIVPALPILRAAHPALRIELRLEDHPVDLVRDGVDLAVHGGLALPDTTDVIAQPLAACAQFIVASPEYLRVHGTPQDIASLSKHAAIGGIRPQSHWLLTEGGQWSRVAVDVQLRVSTLLAIRDAAVAGLGLALLPEVVVADHLAARSLRVVLPGVTAPSVVVHALYRVESKGSPRIDAVLKHLRATVPLAGATDASPRKTRASS
jgi:DNA-binding transcriptional LysR family regulator